MFVREQVGAVPNEVIGRLHHGLVLGVAQAPVEPAVDADLSGFVLAPFGLATQSRPEPTPVIILGAPREYDRIPGDVEWMVRDAGAGSSHLRRCGGMIEIRDHCVPRPETGWATRLYKLRSSRLQSRTPDTRRSRCR